MLERVNHIALAVADIDATLAFYRDGLGLTVAEDKDTDAGRAIRLPVGGSAIVLKEAGGPDRGIDYIAFDADVTEPQAPSRDLNLGLGVVLLPKGEVSSEPPLATGNVQNIDHVVISSQDSGRCAAHFEEKLGLPIKRKMIRPGTSAQLAFAKLGDVIIEFAGPPEPKPGPLVASLWGLVFTVLDIGAARERLTAAGFSASEPKPAVQPTAVISGVRGATGGVPFALIQYNAR